MEFNINFQEKAAKKNLFRACQQYHIFSETVKTLLSVCRYFFHIAFTFFSKLENWFSTRDKKYILCAFNYATDRVSVNSDIWKEYSLASSNFLGGLYCYFMEYNPFFSNWKSPKIASRVHACVCLCMCVVLLCFCVSVVVYNSYWKYKSMCICQCVFMLY